MYPPENAGPDASGHECSAITENRVPTGQVAPGRTGWEKRAPEWPHCLAHPPALALVNVRREWLDACLTLAGAVLGWLIPLLLKQVGSPGCNFYDCGEEILCPLFACFGAGLGLMSAVLWGADHPRGVMNGERTVAG